MDTGDSTTRDRSRGSTILAEMKAAAARRQDPAIGGGTPQEEASERTDPLPRPGTEYAAHGRQMLRPQMTLFLVDKEYLPDGLAYSDLRRCRMVASGEPGKGPVLVLRFTDAEVRIEGRRLYSLCHLIGLHVMPWVWEHPKPEEFTDDQATLIRKISVKEIA